MDQPGTILSKVIFKITGESPCDTCDEHVRQMNEWGWRGCFLNRRIIIGWLVEEAQKRGHTISTNKVASLFIAAMRESRNTLDAPRPNQQTPTHEIRRQKDHYRKLRS